MILVSGLLNIETNLRVDGFPVDYQPVRYPFFGIQSRPSGVGYNLAKALTTLGEPVKLLSLVGKDSSADIVRAGLRAAGVDDGHVLSQLDETAQSVILVAPDGGRAIYTDLKDIQERTYPAAQFDAAAVDCSLLVLSNINFSRPLLARAKAAGKRIATDVHVISALDDAYNRDFMAAADILFQSHERLPCSPEDWARQLQETFGTEIVVIGLGAEGALLAVRRDGYLRRSSVVYTREVVNTVGAGDALFAAFLFTYNQTGDPYLALEKALVFASYKIGANGAAEGFLTAPELAAWTEKTRG